MIKLQQFYVAKFNSKDLKYEGYHFNFKNIDVLRENQELVSLADSQVLRTIRDIRYQRYPSILQYIDISPENRHKGIEQPLEQLKYEKKRLLKDITIENKIKISEINKQIDEILYVPEYVLVVINNNSHYKEIIKNGLFLNGKKFNRLLCGAGMARKNTVSFIREDFEQELKERLQNNFNKEILISDNKYNAYFALASTATYRVSTPNFVLVPDCEIKMIKKVDWVEDVPVKDKIHNKNKIVTCDKELDFNLFDGGGLIDISKAIQWANELKLDYVPSVFIIRNIFIKGCLYVVDFRDFAKNVAKHDTIQDMYGTKYKIEDIDVILTKSQFKLWNAYKSVDHYQMYCEQNKNYWGISRVSPDEDSDYITTNYQFCQVLNLKDKDVANLCRNTISWIQGVSGLNRNHALLFLMGNLAEKTNKTPMEIYNMISDNVTKALIINPKMIQDDYIQQKLISAINKKIKESYIGKLIVNGNFSTMIPDLYAMMQHCFGVDVTGLLKEKEHYSWYWNSKNKSEAVAMRSPLTWRSEVNKLNFIKNEQTEKWFQYINSGIIYNVWDCDCMIHADSDFDGDIVCTTSDSTFIKCKYYDELNNLPITYEKKTVSKHIIKEENLYKADLDSFNSTIGQVTNYSTSFYDLICKYQDDSSEYGVKCYNELLERLKLTRYAQGNAIDKAKGIKCDNYPSHWIKQQKIDEQDSEDIKKYKTWLNDICGDKKPYFFQYRYMESKKEYSKVNKEELDFYKFIEIDNELIPDKKKNNSEQIKQFIDYSNKKRNLIDYGSSMNKICHYMEENLKEINQKRDYKTPESVIGLMKTGDYKEEDIIKIKQLQSQYFEIKKRIRLNIEDEYVDIEQYAKYLRKLALNQFDSIEGMINALIEYAYVRNHEQSKSFAWNVFGNYIVENILKNSNCSHTIPMLDECGDIKYLYKNFKEKLIEL